MKIFKHLVSNEYKRSIAISDAINLLIDKIEKLEKDKNKLKMSLEQREDLLEKMEKEVQLLNSKVKMERKEREINEDQFRKKFDDLTLVNLSMDEKIKNLENFYKMKNKEKSSNFQNILSEYKSTFDSLENEIKRLHSEMKHSENLHKEIIEDIQKSHKNLMENYSGKEIIQNKKLKEYEILFHKLDLENRNYRESIRALNKKFNFSGCEKDLIDLILPKKIDLINEITTIENSQDKIKNNESLNKNLNDTFTLREGKFSNLYTEEKINKHISLFLNTEESLKTLKSINE